MDRPEGQPAIEWRPPMRRPAGTCRGSGGAPTTRSLPSVPRPPVTQGVESRDTGAHERRGFGRAEPVGDPGKRTRRHRHIILVPAVVGDPRNAGGDAAEEEVAPATGLAVSTMPAVPADAYAVAWFPGGNIRADGIDDARDLVPGHSRVLDARPESLLRQ